MAVQLPGSQVLLAGGIVHCLQGACDVIKKKMLANMLQKHSAGHCCSLEMHAPDWVPWNPVLLKAS